MSSARSAVSFTASLVALSLCFGCRSASDVDATAAEALSKTSSPLERAVALAKAGRDEEALRIAAGLVLTEEDPTTREAAMFLSAEAEFRLGFLNESAEGYLALMDAFPRSRAITVIPRRLLAIGVALRDVEVVTLLGVISERGNAIDFLSRVVVDFPGSDVADEAWMELARTHREEGEPRLEAMAYERLLLEYPSSPRAEDARYLAILAWRNQTKGVEYDAEPLRMAQRAAVRYLKRHGREGTYSDQALTVLHSLDAELAEHERTVADFYEGRGEREASTYHDRNADALLGVVATAAGSSRPRRDPRTDRPPWANSGPPLPLMIE